MKNLFTNKNFIQKAVIAIVIMLLFNFAVPVRSSAGIGGVLLDPLFDLVGTILDAITGGLQVFLVDGEWDNSDDGGLLNAFMIDRETFGDGSNYPDFEYKLTPGGTVVKVKQSELDSILWVFPTYAIPALKYTPQKIFSGLIPALDINFVNPTDWTEVKDSDGNQVYENGTEMNKRSIARALHETIASWYVALRNLALVGLMLVLVYVGIRILISSTASDKSKYKQMLMDWLIALCLLLTMHYIMTFTTTIVTEVSKAINGGNQNNGNNISVEVVDDSGTSTGVKFNTDLMGLIRFKMQAPSVLGKLLYLIFYIAMVVYTVMFTFAYLKRVLMIAFLTLISPLVALTYPIDKIRDGKAQAFDMWFKEYVFNALLQPFHLIIYMIFVGSAIDLAAENPLFAIVALAFITPAEKILRKFFGFNKAETSGALGSFAGAAGGTAAYNLLKDVMSGKGKGKGAKGGSGNGKDDKIRTSDPNAPSGVDGFDNPMLSEENSESDNLSNSNTDNPDELNTQQRMVDTYDENFGTDEYDATERDAMAREAYEPESMEYSPEEYANLLRDTGYNEDEIRSMVNEKYGEGAGADEHAEQETPIHEMDEAAERSFMQKLKDGFSGTGKAIKNRAATTLGNKAWRRKVGKNIARGAVRTGLRAVGAIGVGAVGVGVGIAGDDLGDVFKYGSGAAVLGATVGGNALNNMVDSIGNSSPVQGFIGGFTGKTSRERNLERQKQELMTDQKFIDGVKEEYTPNGQELSGSELVKATERAAEFYNYGITDTSDIGKALKLEDSLIKDLDSTNLDDAAKQDLAKQQATTATKIAKKIKDPTKLTDEKYRNNLKKSWTAQIMKNNPNLSQREASINADEIMKRVKQFHKIG